MIAAVLALALLFSRALLSLFLRPGRVHHVRDDAGRLRFDVNRAHTATAGDHAQNRWQFTIR